MRRDFKLKLGIVLVLAGLALPVISSAFGFPGYPLSYLDYLLYFFILRSKLVFVVAVACFFVGIGFVLFAVVEKHE